MTHELTDHKRILDDMLLRRIESGGETEAHAVQQILALVSGVPDDTPMIVGDSDGPSVAARTIRVWAAFYGTPEVEQ